MYRCIFFFKNDQNVVMYEVIFFNVCTLYIKWITADFARDFFFARADSVAGPVSKSWFFLVELGELYVLE